MVMTVDYINRAIKSLARVVSYINDHLMVLLPLSPICILLTVCTRFFRPSHPFLHPFAKTLPPLSPTLHLSVEWQPDFFFFFFTQAH